MFGRVCASNRSVSLESGEIQIKGAMHLSCREKRELATQICFFSKRRSLLVCLAQFDRFHSLHNGVAWPESIVMCNTWDAEPDQTIYIARAKKNQSIDGCGHHKTC